MRVDGINTFGVSAGQFASFGVVSAAPLKLQVRTMSLASFLAATVVRFVSEGQNWRWP